VTNLQYNSEITFRKETGMQTRSIKGSRIFFLDRIFLIAITLFGIFFIAVWFFSNPLRLPLPDGNYKSFTPALFATLRPPVLIAGLVFFIGRDWNAGVFPSVAERSSCISRMFYAGGWQIAKNYFRDFSAIRLNLEGSLLLWRSSSLA